MTLYSAGGAFCLQGEWHLIVIGRLVVNISNIDIVLSLSLVPYLVDEAWWLFEDELDLKTSLRGHGLHLSLDGLLADIGVSAVNKLSHYR